LRLDQFQIMHFVAVSRVFFGRPNSLTEPPAGAPDTGW
jgi:hypothetical protein